jgi:hypothetical protein
MQSFSRFFWLILFTLWSWSAGVAQTASPIKMDVASPLAVTDKPLAVQVRFGRWFPVAVTLSNTGEPVRGTLTLKLSSSTNEQHATSTFVTEVDLPTVARKRVWLYGRLERGESNQATVTWSGRGIETREVRFVLDTPDAGARVVLTISDSEERLSYLSGLNNRRLGIAEEMEDGNFVPDAAATRGGVNPNQARRFAQPLGKAHEWVPDRAIGLDGLDAVVLHDFPHTALTPEQLTAVRGYVASGGALIVLGGSQWQRLATSPLADLWPLTPASSTPASAAEVRSLVNNYVTKNEMDAGDRLGGAPVIVVRSTLKPGSDLLAGSTSAPMMALALSGAGQVVFLAFDPTQPPFLGWSGLGELWATVFSKTARPGVIQSVDKRLEMPGYTPDQGGNYRYQYAEQSDANAVQPTNLLWTEMVRSPQMRTPPVSYIAWFLALYVFFLVPVNYCVLRFLDRRELAWVTVPVIVLAFSLLSYFAALRIKGSIVRTRHVNIVQGSLGSTTARSDAMLWLFSPRKSTYEIVGSDPQVVAAPYLDGSRSNSRDESTIWQPGVQQPFAVRDTLINMWDYKTFTGHAAVSLGKGIEVRRAGSNLEVVNNSGHDLRGVMLVNGGRVATYGDLANGQRASKVLRMEDNGAVDPGLRGAIERATAWDKIFPRQDADAYRKMAQGALGVALGSNFGKNSEGVMLVAWSTKPVMRLAATGEDPQAQDVALWVLRAGANAVPAVGVAQTQMAGVKLVGVESGKIPGNQSPAATTEYLPQSRTYEANFATPPDDVTIALRGQISNPYGYGYRYGYLPGMENPEYWKKLRQIEKVEVWNFAARRWQSISGQLTRTNKGNSETWQWQGRLKTAALQNSVRRPDNVLRLRVQLPHGIVRVRSVRLESSRAGR